MSTESEVRQQIADIWEEVHELGTPNGEYTDEWAKVVNLALKHTEALITRREQEAEAALILKFEGALADHATEVRIGNDLAWRQVVYWDDVESVLAALTHPTPADSLNLSKSKGLKPAKDFDPSQVTLCPGCNQMTHTIMSDTKGNEDYCGKCGKVKPADNSDSGRPEKLGGPQTRDFAAEAKQVEKILNRPHEPDYQCTQCSKSPAEHTTAGAGDTPTKTEN